MSALFSKARLGIKAWQELGSAAPLWYALYRLGLRTGWTPRRTQAALKKVLSQPTGPLALHLLPLPDPQEWVSLLDAQARHSLLQQADEVSQGRMRLFGADLAPIVAIPAAPLPDWSAIDDTLASIDLKFTWEPGRFGWVYPLAQVFAFNGDERWPLAFWSLSQAFFDANPPYQGAQWASGQETALRLVSLVFAAQAFHAAPASTPERIARLAQWIAMHAARIPPTLAYARAQNNNHLLSEAAGLFTAGLALPQHPQAASWRLQGWRLFQQGLADQIAPDGVYIQHSANYQRLMLQLALWVGAIGAPHGFDWPAESKDRLSAAACWLAALLDPLSGQTPNLGPNDGAYIMPLSQCAFADYRPVLQAAWRAFVGQPLLPPGPWDDLSLWLGLPPITHAPVWQPQAASSSPLTLHHPQLPTWCYLRAAHFNARPGHADQLHLDLWWRGLNLAQDPGTYRYTAEAPWDNALAHTAVHNTITLDGLEQMTRLGRFLYLDWSQAAVSSPPPMGEGPGVRDFISARHNGYCRLGASHERRVEAIPQGWKVTDRILPIQTHKDDVVTTSVVSGRVYVTRRVFCTRLHWLLPDWPWEIQALPDGLGLSLDSPFGPLRLEIALTPALAAPAIPSPEGRGEGEIANSPPPMREGRVGYAKAGVRACLARAGQTLYGDIPAQPTWGWVSPQYGRKEPALSLSAEANGSLPLTWITTWILPS